VSTPLRRICIVGAGAIGGLIGTRLAALPDTEVSAIARGDTLQALREHGWRLSDGRGLQQHLANAVSEHAGELGPQDLVVIAVKAPALGAVVAGMAPLLAPHTIVLPAMNGVPWW
jgi:2-dehydropantoate 2-reductase